MPLARLSLNNLHKKDSRLPWGRVACLNVAWMWPLPSQLKTVAVRPPDAEGRLRRTGTIRQRKTQLPHGFFLLLVFGHDCPHALRKVVLLAHRGLI